MRVDRDRGESSIPYHERNYKNPGTSEKMLLSFIKSKNGANVGEIVEFERNNDLYFGAEDSAVSATLKDREDGLLKFNEKTGAFSLSKKGRRYLQNQR